jgi:hypothetical protein
MTWRGAFDPNPDEIAFHGQRDDFDIISDALRLLYFARQNQHRAPLGPAICWSRPAVFRDCYEPADIGRL